MTDIYDKLLYFINCNYTADTRENFSGAIKFGDKLTLEQCRDLIKSLRYTKSPNRCAHGRPTMIPVMELSELEKRNVRIREVCIKVHIFRFYITKKIFYILSERSHTL